MGKKNRVGHGLVGGVLILTVANLLVKVFGFLYKVPLNRMLGDEMANVNAAYSVYTLLYMISTAGIPVAVSVMVSRERAAGRADAVQKIFSVSMTALGLIGAAGTALLLALARPVSMLNSGGDSFLCLLAIAPALFFICLCSVYRGYYQGFGLMTPTAVSEVIEAFGKMALGLLFVLLVVHRFSGGTHLAAACSVLGITVGIGFGALYLMSVRRRYIAAGLLAVPSFGEKTAEKETFREAGVPERESSRGVFRRLLAIAVPIALTSGVMSLASLIDSQLMRPLLTAYYGDAARAKAVFSDYSTGAVTLFNMPAVLVYPICCAIVPYITAARAGGRSGEAERIITTAIRVAAILALPASFGMSLLARPILSVVFLGDADMALSAGGPLSILALSIFPLAMLAVTNASLQACGRQGDPIVSMSAAVAVKLASLFFFTPRVGALGAPLSTLFFYVTAILLNFFFLFRCVSLRPDVQHGFLLPLLGALSAAAGAYGVYGFAETRLPEAVALLLALVFAVLLYGFVIFPGGCITREDLSFLPLGGRIGKRLQKARSPGKE